MKSPPSVAEPLDRLDRIRLQVAKAWLVVNDRQWDALRVLSFMSDHLRLVAIGESTIDYSRCLVVEVDGGRRVEVSTDGQICETSL